MSKRYSCIIVDDEALGRELIATHLAHLPQFELVASCANAIEASRILAEQRVDLMFLDIEMPVMKGTDFYQNLAQAPAVIFTTAYRDYAVQGFDLEAVDYLLKPIVFTRFFKAIQRFLASVENPVASTPEHAAVAIPDDLFVRIDRKNIRLRRQDILYVRSMKDYLEVHTKSDRYLVKSTISGFADKLGPGFLRIHRSYLVNQHHITAVTRHDVELGDIELPISDACRDAVFDALGAT
ncbi:MAG: LytTR family DNA-binding domain-containing protein [Wenzhouxiangellaceae bacterium]